MLFAAMAKDYLDGIKSLRRDIDEYIGVHAAEERLLPLLVVLQGEGLSRENVSSRVLTDWLERIRKGVYRVTDYLLNGVVTQVGRPNGVLIAATDPYVLSVQPGSLRIGLRLPEVHHQSDLLEPVSVPEKPMSHTAVEKLLDVIHWASAGNTEELPHGYSDRDALALIASEARKLVPPRRGAVHLVRYAGAMSPVEGAFDVKRDADRRLKGLVEILTTSTEETVFGLIREIDLDARRFTLRERGAGLVDLRCHVPADLMPLAEELLGESVSVRGLVNTLSPRVLHVTTLERSGV